MKNITLSVPEKVYRRARIKAAEKDTSVSALVAEFLARLAEEETEAESLKRRLLMVREEIGHFEVGKHVRRDELHER